MGKFEERLNHCIFSQCKEIWLYEPIGMLFVILNRIFKYTKNNDKVSVYNTGPYACTLYYNILPTNSYYNIFARALLFIIY